LVTSALTANTTGRKQYCCRFIVQGLALNDGNTAVGHAAGGGITTGQYNTAIGLVSATSLVFTGSYNSSIGYNANPSAAGSSGQFTLGDANITDLRCNDTTISALSDQRDKTDVIDSPYGLDFINTVRPVQFKWETRDGNAKDGSTRIGFLAQELLEATDGNNAVLDLVLDDNPEKLEAKYGNLLPIAIKAIQELSTQLDAALARITTLEG
jgi:trimeric autotransporter adhesin